MSHHRPHLWFMSMTKIDIILLLLKHLNILVDKIILHYHAGCLIEPTDCSDKQHIMYICTEAWQSMADTVTIDFNGEKIVLYSSFICILFIMTLALLAPTFTVLSNSTLCHWWVTSVLPHFWKAPADVKLGKPNEDHKGLFKSASTFDRVYW